MSKFLWIIVRTLEFILGEMESRRVTAADSWFRRIALGVWRVDWKGLVEGQGDHFGGYRNDPGVGCW